MIIGLSLSLLQTLTPDPSSTTIMTGSEGFRPPMSIRSSDGQLTTLTVDNNTRTSRFKVEIRMEAV